MNATSRILLLAIGVLAVDAFQSPTSLRGISSKQISWSFPAVPITKTDAEWREELSPDAYRVLRQDGTEPANTSPLNDVKDDGVFVCAGCKSPLYQTSTKFESGSGWPSFYAPIDGDAVDLTVDYKLVIPRTEVRCAKCGGHLGHVFDDGPQPTGKRYCMNGVAMNFYAEGEDLELSKEVLDRTNDSDGAVKVKEPLAAVLPAIGIDVFVGGLFIDTFIKQASNGIDGLFDYLPLAFGAIYSFNAIRKIAGLLSNAD